MPSKTRNKQNLSPLSKIEKQIYFLTRMHSSRMRTGRSLTACCSLLPGGVLPGLGGVCLVPGGFSRPGGGGLPGRGGSAWSGGMVSQHALRQTPPVNRMTNRLKNITLARTSLRPVINQKYYSYKTNCTILCSDRERILDLTHHEDDLWENIRVQNEFGDCGSLNGSEVLTGH